MASCENIRIPHRKLCVGDLDRRITLKSRQIAADGMLPDYLLNFTNNGDVWAAVQTAKAGETVFDESNTEAVITHTFFIRFISGLTSEEWIELEGENYDILTVEDFDERHEWMRLKTTVRGISSEPVNFA